MYKQTLAKFSDLQYAVKVKNAGVSTYHCFPGVITYPCSYPNTGLANLIAK